MGQAIFLLILALAAAGVLVAILWFGATRAREQRDRQRILEDAMRDGHLDDETRQALLKGLVREREGRTERSSLRRHGGIGRIAFGLGWLCMIGGIGLIATEDRDAVPVGGFFLVLGFGMVTLPMALLEYDRRRSPAGNDS